MATAIARLLLPISVISLIVPGISAGAKTGDGKLRPLGAAGNWHLVFGDEFDSEELNPQWWTTCYWWNDNGCTNLSTKELEWYQPGNIDVSGGLLKLIARAETVAGYQGRRFDFTSGMVTTGRDYKELPRPPRFEFLYGQVDIRAKTPAGQGLWPALWMLPSDRNSTPEIDIMENLGQATTHLEVHFHYKDKHGETEDRGQSLKVPDLSADWHIYGLRWEPTAVTWYLDGVEQWRYTDRAHIPNAPMYLLMNLAVGGAWPGPPDAKTLFPAEFLVDYVRVWQPGKP